MKECQRSRKAVENEQRQQDKCDALAEKIEALKAKLLEEKWKRDQLSKATNEQQDRTIEAIYQAQRHFDFNNDLADNASEHLRDGWEAFKEEHKIDFTY